MFLRYNYLAILWAILMLFLSAIPPEEYPKKGPFPNFDKIIHFYLHAQLTFLLIVGFIKQNRFRFLRYRAVSMALLLSFSYGIAIEILQRFVFIGRSVELYDLIADFLGTIFGILVFYIIYGKNPV